MFGQRKTQLWNVGVNWTLNQKWITNTCSLPVRQVKEIFPSHLVLRFYPIWLYLHCTAFYNHLTVHSHHHSPLAHHCRTTHFPFSHHVSAAPCTTAWTRAGPWLYRVLEGRTISFTFLDEISSRNGLPPVKVSSRARTSRNSNVCIPRWVVRCILWVRLSPM